MARPSAAQCLLGMPCTIPATPNDPYDGTISPNTSGPNANKTDSDMCDADFMNQIYAKAFMEAERENILNEVLVRKTDSALEYSCFEQMVNMTAHLAGPLFSESDYWWNRDIEINNGIGDENDWQDIDNAPVFVSMCAPDNPSYPSDNTGTYSGDAPADPCEKLDQSLEDLVLFSLYEHVSKNFAHDYLGGYAAGFNNDITGEIGGATYLCDMMYVVNLMARCDDFDTDDKFFEFDTLVGLDPRILPEQCTGGTPFSDEMIKVVKNDGAKYAAWDLMSETYLDKMLNIGTTDPVVNTCADPIPTGIKIKRYDLGTDAQGSVTVSNTDEYDEHVCINPGCSYVFQQDKCLPP